MTTMKFAAGEPGQPVALTIAKVTSLEDIEADRAVVAPPPEYSRRRKATI